MPGSDGWRKPRTARRGSPGSHHRSHRSSSLPPLLASLAIDLLAAGNRRSHLGTGRRNSPPLWKAPPRQHKTPVDRAAHRAIGMKAAGKPRAAQMLGRPVFTSLPSGLGFHGEPLWWPLLPLTLAGLPVGLTIRYLPGKGGHAVDQ